LIADETNVADRLTTRCSSFNASANQ